MKDFMTKCAVSLSLISCFSGLSTAQGSECNQHTLNGRYIFTASGFYRPAPGTPWVPKAIFEVLVFNGDGTIDAPFVTLANPSGDTGVVTPPSTGEGTYTLNEDCTGTINFAGPPYPAYTIFVSPRGADEIWMILTNPPQHVLQGTAKRK